MRILVLEKSHFDPTPGEDAPQERIYALRGQVEISSRIIALNLERISRRDRSGH